MHIMIVLINTNERLGPDFPISGQGHGHVTLKLVLKNQNGRRASVFFLKART